MISCQRAKDLIESVVDGTIDSDQLDVLKTHTETCAACRAELARCHLVEEVVKDAFVSQTGAEQAGERIAERIAAQPQAPVRTVRYGAGWARMAVAAAVVLAAGLLIGFVAGRIHPGKSAGAPPLVQVPMQVGDLEGTVLVKHDNSDVWEPLQSGAAVYLGDMFHSTPRSGFVLELEDNESTIEVNQNSMLALTSYNGETQFSLEQGECTASLESPHGPFFINTPHGQVEALGTEFTVTVE